MNKFKLIIFIVIFLVTIGVIFRFLTPQFNQITDQPIPPNYDGTNTTFSKITFVGTEPKIPPSLPIGVVNLSSNKDSFITTILTKYNLKPIGDNFWESDEYQLSYNPQENQFLLVTTKPPNQTSVVDQLLAKKAAEDFLLSVFNGNPDFQPVTGSTRFMLGYPESAFVAPGLASFITIDYSQTISDIPVVLDLNENFALNLTIDSDLRVIKMVYRPKYANFTKQSEVSTISVYEAIKNINRNQGAVVSAFGEKTAFFSLDSLTNGKMDSVNLEYRALTETNKVAPYFRFTGTAFTNDGNRVEVQIITPAYKL